jgi:nicotinamide N-methyltransferase
MFYTHHKPHFAERDLAIFEVARETGWVCDKVLTERFAVRCYSRFMPVVY